MGALRPDLIRGCQRAVAVSVLLSFIVTSTTNVFFFFWLLHAACKILVPQPGLEPMLLAGEAQSLNPWTTKEVPKYNFLTCSVLSTDPTSNVEKQNKGSPY